MRSRPTGRTGNQDHRGLSGRRADRFVRANLWRIYPDETGQNVVVENKAGASGSVAALEAKRSAPDGYTLMFTISTTMIMNRVLIKDIPYRRRKGFCAGLDHAGRAARCGEKRGKLAEFVDPHQTVENQLQRRRLLRAHGDRRNEQAVWPQDGSGALSRRSADVDRSCRRLHRWRPRQPWRGVAGLAERPRPRGRRLAQAHVGIAGCSYLHGAGFNRAPVPVDRLPVLRRAGGDAPGNRSKTVETPRRRRQDRKAAAAHEIIRRRRYRDDLRGDAETLQGRICRSGSRRCRASGLRRRERARSSTKTPRPARASSE